MCLSTVYKDEKKPEYLLMGNVMHIKCVGDEVIMTDLLGRQTVFKGSIAMADLNSDYFIVKSINSRKQ